MTRAAASRPAELRRILRFLAVGGLNTAFGYACYAGFLLIGLPVGWSVAGSTIVGMVFNFFSYGALVFGGASGSRLQRFLAFYVGLGVMNYLLLRLAMTFGPGPLLAQAFLLPALALMGYLGMRNWVFRR